MDTVYSKPSATGDAGLPDSAPEPSLPLKTSSFVSRWLSLAFFILFLFIFVRVCISTSFSHSAVSHATAPELILHLSPLTQHHHHHHQPPHHHHNTGLHREERAMTTISGSSPDISANGVANQGNHLNNTTNTTEQCHQPQSLPIPQHQYTQDDEEQREKQPQALSSIIADLHHRIHVFLSESHPQDSLLAAVQHQTRSSLSVFASALARYPLSHLSLSYNGGKDCLVLLVLFLASLYPHPAPGEEGALDSIPAIYALPPDSFPAVEDFVRSSARAYHLHIIKYTTDPPRTTLKSSFRDYLELNPSIKAIFVGTRRTDPHGANLTHFDRTDSGWPDFVRIHPVIDWHYAEIWSFIRHLGLEYCPLYDRGYTSLGGTTDTHPNPKLRVDSHLQQQNKRDLEQEAQNQQYRPAYELTEDFEERLGRN